MITISESSPKMMVGTKSLFITFDSKPTPDELDIIKATHLHYYDYKNYTWEVPILELAYLLDNLTYFDSIRLVLEPDPINIYANAKPLLEPKTKSFEHQVEAVEFGLRNKKWMLLDAPGLGKSKSLINLAEELKCQRGIKHCLVICGIASLRSNWEDEIKKHSNLSSMIVGKKIGKRGGISYMTMKERAEQLRNPIDEFFIIINIESLRDDSIVEAINNSSNSFDMMVVDECHKCFDYNTFVKTDLGDLKIGDIVSNDINCKVLSCNNKGSLEYRNITSKNQFICDELLELTIEDEQGNKHIIRCTKNHRIFTHNRGYVDADSLTEEDILEVLN